MFTIEHEFDATVITLVDEGADPRDYLQEDITISSFEDCVVVEQLDEQTDQVQTITFSHAQLRELAAALNLPEGVYRLKKSEAPTEDG
ncbi:MAG: hypothetical protein H5U24_13725 [Thioclava marina]|jgi:hypothetical protein|uniref:Phosphomannomutase n=1 Tax=Thioclava marina TaxID=1915077 RepID=A0ABX3MJP9_9RHOB|nr:MULTISPECIES: hypothetical protein [Thioclava]TNE92332.1 MAG: hypothetical protein EP337_05540 [Paracoccaceae bacterium]MBC7146443.1 hypothetical protein [Thioclava marina]MBD3803356.1 hypothetical protein [Thioclava sp.]OOY11696.1 hypothetical protein BMG00_11430 [Thioclava marina]OOY27502.1 hypothetical protein BMI90_12955 [Thioclava sp. L04-15]